MQKDPYHDRIRKIHWSNIISALVNNQPAINHCSRAQRHFHQLQRVFRGLKTHRTAAVTHIIPSNVVPTPPATTLDRSTERAVPSVKAINH